MDSILIVDDEKDILEALRRMLRGLYAVDIADSPIEALQLIQSKVYHVIISDQRMPEMTGVEFLEKAKRLSPLSTRILLTGYTDIESVIDSINRGNIYRYISKPWEPEELKLTLRQANESFLLKREIEEKNRNLEQALKELRVLDQAKSRFLALVSHELNTPLTVLNSFVELISEQKEELSAEFSKAFSSIEGASHRLSDIVREVVEYVRLESNPKIHKSPTDLSALLKEVVTELQEKARKKKVTLQFLASEKVVLELDQEKIRVGLKGLLEDVISRSPENSPVEIKLTEAGGSVTLLVTRSGLPMTEEALKAFETGQSLMNHHQNLALGLAICRTVLERHSAKMSLQNSNQQSTISIEIKKSGD